MQAGLDAFAKVLCEQGAYRIRERLLADLRSRFEAATAVPLPSHETTVAAYSAVQHSEVPSKGTRKAPVASSAPAASMFAPRKPEKQVAYKELRQHLLVLGVWCLAVRVWHCLCRRCWFCCVYLSSLDVAFGKALRPAAESTIVLLQATPYVLQALAKSD